MQSSLTILKYFLIILDFVEFLATPFGLSAMIVLLLWSRFILLGWLSKYKFSGVFKDVGKLFDYLLITLAQIKRFG